MAGLWCDSFDHYQTANLVQKYDDVDGATIVAAVGTCGTQALRTECGPSNTGIVRGVAASGNRIISEARVKYVSGVTSFVIGQVWYAGARIFRFRRGTDGSIVGHVSPTAAFPPVSFVTPGGLFPADTWVKVGYDLTLGYTGLGAVTIQIDGQEVYSQSGLYTSPSTDLWTGVSLAGQQQGTTVLYFDDWTVCDGSGSRNNTLLGNKQVQWIPPDGAGATTDWAVTGAATNWQVSASNTPDISTIYVSTDVASAVDTYSTADLPLIANTEIPFVMVSILASEETAGSREVEAVTRQGGTDYPSGTTHGVPTTDATYLPTILETNPATAGDWALNDVNADEMSGVKLTV